MQLVPSLCHPGPELILTSDLQMLPMFYGS